MDKTELLKIFDREQRIQFEFPGVKKEISGGVMRNLMPGEQMGFIVYANLNESTADAEIESTVDASPMSRPILEKHGFQFLGFSTPCVWKPDDLSLGGENG